MTAYLIRASSGVETGDNQPTWGILSKEGTLDYYLPPGPFLDRLIRETDPFEGMDDKGLIGPMVERFQRYGMLPPGRARLVGVERSTSYKDPYVYTVDIPEDAPYAEFVVRRPLEGGRQYLASFEEGFMVTGKTEEATLYVRGSGGRSSSTPVPLEWPEGETLPLLPAREEVVLHGRALVAAMGWSPEAKGLT